MIGSPSPFPQRDGDGTQPVFGAVLPVPYDLSPTPGGSSGGAAAAVAMGFSALELGTDIGGSVRITAAFYGVYGHKTSYRIISPVGHAAGGTQVAPQLLSVIGPLARAPGDLALLLEAVAGPDEEDYANRLVLPRPRNYGEQRPARFHARLSALCVMETKSRTFSEFVWLQRLLASATSWPGLHVLEQQGNLH